MKLYDLINKYPVLEIDGSLDKDIWNIEHDSRKISINNLFVAKKGFNEDGHEFINQAIENGSNTILGERKIKLNEDITNIRVEDSTDALAYLSGNFYNWPSKKLNMIGITGTNGKTSVSYYIKTILDTYDHKVGILGTIGGILDREILSLNNTTPNSLDLHRLINEMVKRDRDYCIMEVSSHALDLKRVEYIDYDIGIFTNLSQDHLDYHKTMDKYFKSKLKLFKKTKRYNIINIDDKYGRIIREDVKNRVPYITYGLNQLAMVYGSNITYNDKGIDFTLNMPKESIKVNLNVPGEFSLYNALAAAACAYSLNIDITMIKKGLESFQGAKGRFELVPNKLGLNIIIDFAHTPEGLEAILRTIKSFAKGKIYLLFGAGGNRDIEKRPKMGEIAGKYADISIITTDNPRFENPKDIIDDIVEGVKNTDGEYITITDREEAIRYGILNAKSKDILVLAGKGHETNMIIGSESISFDERKIIKKIINMI